MDIHNLKSDLNSSTRICCSTENTSNSCLNSCCGVVGGGGSSHQYEHPQHLPLPTPSIGLLPAPQVSSTPVFNVPSAHQYGNPYRPVTSPYKCHNLKNFQQYNNHCNPNSVSYNLYNDNNSHHRHHHRQPKHSRFTSRNSAAAYRRNNSPHVLSKIVFHAKNDPIQKGESVCDKSNVSQQQRHYYHKRNSKFDLNYQHNNNNNFANFNRTNSIGNDDDLQARRRKPRRKYRGRKRTFNESFNNSDQQSKEKRLKWTECNSSEVSRLHRDCVQNGQPLAPYNTTQFIMNEHNAEKEIDFDELSGQIQQMHNKRVAPNCNTSDCDSAKEDYYSSPEDESFFLEQQFHEAYDTMHAERLNSMSKSDLLKEYLMIEKELEVMKQKRNEKPIESLEEKSATDHACSTCVTNRTMVKENKDLVKLLKYLYSRYNSLIYCIGYVDNSNSGSTNDDKLKNYSLTSDLHYRISKYICHQDSSIHSSSSTTSTSTSSTYNSSTTSITSDDDEDDSLRTFQSIDLYDDDDDDITMVVHSLVSQLVAKVAQGNS